MTRRARLTFLQDQLPLQGSHQGLWRWPAWLRCEPALTALCNVFGAELFQQSGYQQQRERAVVGGTIGIGDAR
jgi:hypothetical protein|nr:MAG TPA_asm: hypothetical protein [Bacteriophage sp.]